MQVSCARQPAPKARKRAKPSWSKDDNPRGIRDFTEMREEGTSVASKHASNVHGVQGSRGRQCGDADRLGEWKL